MSLRTFPWLADILREVYDKLDQREDEPQDPTWTLGEIVRAANRAQDYIVREMQSCSRNWHLKYVDTQTITANSRTVTMPSDCRNIRLISELGSDGEELQRWEPGRPEDSGRTPFRFIPQPHLNTVLLSETPTSQATLRVWYQPYQYPVVHGIAQTAGSTTIQLADHESSEDDIYNGLEIYVSSGTGAGQTKTITDYVGSTRIATVSSWTTVPSTDSYYTSRPSLPRDADLVFLYTLLCNLVEKNDGERYGQFFNERSLHMAALKKYAQHYEQAGPQTIINKMPGSFMDPLRRFVRY